MEVDSGGRVVDLDLEIADAGRGDETQVTRSETQFRSLRAELPRYQAMRQSGLFRLSMLLAKPLDQLPAGVATCAELPHIAQLLPVGDGAALLKRRPDVRQAERHLSAATAQTADASRRWRAQTCSSPSSSRSMVNASLRQNR